MNTARVVFGALVAAWCATGCLRQWPPERPGVRASGDVPDVGKWEDGGPERDATDAACGVAQDGAVAKQIAVGAYHACALMSDGTVRCWGLNLGVVPPVDAGVPQCQPGEVITRPREVVGLPRSVTQVVAGGREDEMGVPIGHTCALTREGAVYCWGANRYGQVTRTAGAPPHVEAPRPVNTVGWASGRIVQLSAGDGCTCARLDTGPIYCWGDPNNGQLGAPSGSAVSMLPADVAEVFAGALRVCVTTREGRAICWGENGQGQLGNDTDVGGRDVRTPVRDLDGGADLRNVAQITATGASTCVRLRDGTVYCWGDPSHGRLGTGLLPDAGVRRRPTLPATLSPESGVTGLAAGSDYACALARQGRQILCWGSNNYHAALGRPGGDLCTPPGPDEFTCLATPTALLEQELTDDAFVQIAMRHHFACALTCRGRVLCWGWNQHAQLGRGTCNVEAPQVMPPDYIDFDRPM